MSAIDLTALNPGAWGHVYSGIATASVACGADEPGLKLFGVHPHRPRRLIFEASAHRDQLGGDADGDFGHRYGADVVADGGVHARERFEGHALLVEVFRRSP